MPKTICWFDIESTGLNKATDRIIQLSLIKTLGLSEIIEKKKLSFNNDGVSIHPDAEKAHGISHEMIAICYSFSTYAKIVYEYIQSCDIIGGYNCKDFDIPMLAEEFARSNIEWIPKEVIDCAVIFKKKEQRNLTAALKFYAGEEMDGAHDAENDVLATIKVAIGQTFRYGFDCAFISDSVVASSLEDVLISESKYDNEKERIDYHNKIVLNDDLVAVWGFGKNKEKPIKQDMGYVDWILGLNDFPNTTKNLIRKIIAK